MRFSKLLSAFKSRRAEPVPSLSLYHNFEDSATLDATTPNVTFGDFLQTLPSLNKGSYKDAFKFIPKKIRGHFHTVLSTLTGPPKGDLKMKVGESIYLYLADGGQIKIDVSSMDGDPKTPIVIGFHGIGGSSEAAYINEGLALLNAAGVRTAAVNLRACGGQKMTATGIHNAGQVNDVGAAVGMFSRHFPEAPIFLIGGSLGAGMSHNFIALADCPVSGALLFSAVFDFTLSSKSIPKAFDFLLGKEFTKMVDANNVVFTPEFLQDMMSLSSSPSSSSPPSLTSSSTSTLDSDVSTSPVPSMASTLHRPVLPRHASSITQGAAAVLTEKLWFTEFCDQLCAPSNGFDSPEELKETTSSVNAIPNTRIPVLALNANDDPLLGGGDLPRSQMSQSAYSAMAVTRTGGHLGWFGKGRDGLKTESKRWSTRVAVEYFLGLIELGVKARPRAKIVPCGGGWWCPEGMPEMRFMETSSPMLGELILACPYYKRS